MTVHTRAADVYDPPDPGVLGILEQGFGDADVDGLELRIVDETDVRGMQRGSVNDDVGLSDRGSAYHRILEIAGDARPSARPSSPSPLIGRAPVLEMLIGWYCRRGASD
jgi:hypothetical protein